MPSRLAEHVIFSTNPRRANRARTWPTAGPYSFGGVPKCARIARAPLVAAIQREGARRAAFMIGRPYASERVVLKEILQQIHSHLERLLNGSAIDQNQTRTISFEIRQDRLSHG